MIIYTITVFYRNSKIFDYDKAKVIHFVMTFVHKDFYLSANKTNI